MICNICEKESVCKLIDGCDVVKCAEFLGIKETDYKMTSDDCISRAQALSDYADWYGYGYRDNTFYKRLKDMSPVTPKPKTDVLDKIRAEIEQMNNIDYVKPVTVDEVLQIIDKYTAEKEQE